MVIPWENLDKLVYAFFIYNIKLYEKRGMQMANCIIYAYAKPSGKIVYVGQTKQLSTRHKQHMEYDPYRPTAVEYNYPLSRGVRKYGKDYYSLVILEENVPPEKLDNREKYWIKHFNTYWDGYNQTMGGTVFGKREEYTDETIDKAIDLLQNTTVSFQKIKEITGLSFTHIYNINIGERRFREDINYPIRPKNTVGTKGIIFSQEQVLEIHKLLAETKISMNKIADKFHCHKKTISNINQGTKQCYHLDGWSYPIRNTHAWVRENSPFKKSK